MWPFRKKTEALTLLRCQGSGCRARYREDAEPNLPDHVKSMQAALRAHEAGWFAAGGQILCPDCVRAQRGESD